MAKISASILVLLALFAFVALNNSKQSTLIKEDFVSDLLIPQTP